MTLTPRQANVMDHALAYPKQYRNHFCAVPGTPNDKTWTELVELGYAEYVNSPGGDGIHKVYRVTDIGIEKLILYHDYKGRP